ncbi:hypothetical protein FNJ84_01200 [Paracoccus sp. M683]|nr:hypothetical protein FNJ84_01200 [Paracoccus sp. M683]
MLLPLLVPAPSIAQPQTLSQTLPQTLPPGLTSARLLPGWTDDQGRRIAALELVLEPGWKTYWRSPGDSGIPPSFDWQGSDNLGDVTFHWPAPELIDSGGSLSFGFHDRLVLPFEVTPKQPDQPINLTATVEFGLCENICIPANLTLKAPPAADRPDPAIQAALDRRPIDSALRPSCRLDPIEDGMQIDVTLADAGGFKALAVEFPGRPEVWVSVPDAAFGPDGGLTASADLVPPEGAPFDLDPADLLFTLIGDQQVMQMQGCDPTG